MADAPKRRAHRRSHGAWGAPGASPAPWHAPPQGASSPQSVPSRTPQSRLGVELRAAGRRAGLDPLTDADEPHAKRRQLVQEHDQVPQVPSEAIQPPNEEGVEPPAPRSLQVR
jgi:hypothetical protein